MRPERDPEFQKLWIGQTISEIGSRISREGIPYSAVLLLHATPEQMGVLAAIGSGSVLLFSTAAGVLVDRVRRGPVMILTDIGRALVLATIPLAFSLGRLTFTHLAIVAALAGLLTVLFDVAYQTYFPNLVATEDLLRANRLLGMSAASAEMLGPGLTGVLVGWITAPRAIALDALSFLVSAGSVLAIRRKEQLSRDAKINEHWTEEALAGAKMIAGHPLLRVLAIRAITAFFFVGTLASLYILFAVDVLHLKPAALGLAIALGGAGSLVGAAVSERVSKRLGLGRAFFLSALFTCLFNLLTPAATLAPAFALLFYCAAQFFGDAGWSIYFINEQAFRQQVAPPEMLGRVNAAMQLATRGVLPIGALVGGIFAGRFGVTAAMWASALGLLLSCVWLIPVRNYRASEEPIATRD